MDRLIDRIQANDWSNITTDIEKVTAMKINNKIQGYVSELKDKGTISDVEVEE